MFLPFLVAVSLATVNLAHICTYETWWYCPTINVAPLPPDDFNIAYSWRTVTDSRIAYKIEDIPKGSVWKRVRL